ncbi:MAG: type II secretion system F family protein [Actinobacteria bacterium]|nr:type II secretion system F family protein [Actinomycetota bacterium]
MRWLALGIFAAFSILLLWYRGVLRARKTARKYVDKHLGRNSNDKAGFIMSGPFSKVSRTAGNSLALSKLRSSMVNSGIKLDWDTVVAFWLWLLVASPTLTVALLGNIIVAVPAFIAVLFLPPAALPIVKRVREKNLIEQLERLTGDLALYLQCGIPVEKAVELLADDFHQPIKEHMDRLKQEFDIGTVPDKALMELAAMFEDSELVLVAQTLKTSRETGADVSRVMESIGITIRERAAMKRELRTQTIQGKMSGQMVAALPLLFLALIAVISRNALMTLVTTVPGLIMLGTALTLDIIGFKWINKILDIKI